METRTMPLQTARAQGGGERFAYIDVLSCVMYFAVILYHTTVYFCRYAYSTLPPLPDISKAGYVDFVMMAFGLLGVPFFFARCGFFMLSRQSSKFLSRNLGKLLGISGFYIGIYSIILLVAIGNFDHIKGILRFALLNDDAGIVGGGTISGIPMYFVWDSWFIYALIPIYLLIPLLAKAEPLRDWRAATFCLAGLYYLAFIHPVILESSGLPYGPHSNMEVYAFYFLLGYWIFTARDKLSRLGAPLALIAFVATFVANLFLGHWLYKTGSSEYMRVFRGYNAPLTPVMCVWLFAAALSAKSTLPELIRKFTESVSNVGIDIYLVHTLFLMLFLGFRVFPDTHWLPVRQVGYAIAVAAASVATAFARKWLFGAIKAGAQRS